MPIIKSAKKRARQAVVRRARNTTLKKNIKKTSKSFKAALGKKSKPQINEQLRAYQSLLDTAVKKNYIHRKEAARRLSIAMQAAQGMIETGSRKSAGAKRTTAKKVLRKKAQPVAKAKKTAVKTKAKTTTISKRAQKK